MAQKPDGKAAKTERVLFTRPAAERIGRAVRIVEAGDRDSGPLVFGANIGRDSQPVFRIATFTGAWTLNGIKTVTFFSKTSTPNTASVTNYLFTIPASDNTSATTKCAIAKEGTSWFLVNTLHNLDTGVLVSPSLTSAALQFTRVNINVVGATASTAGISVTNCSTQQASSQSFNMFIG